MTFRASASRGGLVGLVLLCAVAALLAAALWSMAALPLGPASAVLGLSAFALLPVTARLIFWVWGYFALRYEVTRDGLVIHWAATEQVIPMPDVLRITSGRPAAGRVSGVVWPGYQVGHGAIETSDGTQMPLLVYATAGSEGQLVVWTPSVAYAVSPEDPARFIEEIQLRHRLGPVQRLTQETRRPRIARLPVWSDSLILRLAIAAVVVNALLFAWTAWRQPGLAPSLVLQYRFDAAHKLFVPAGPPRPREALWSLPLIGGLMLVANAALAVIIHERARLAAVLLVAGAFLTQIVIGLALGRIG